MLDSVPENDPAWAEACRREEAFRDLLRRYPDRLTVSAVEDVASELGLSRATAYRLIAVLCSKRNQQKEACTFLTPLAEGDWSIFLSAGGYGSAFSAFGGGALS